MTPGSEPFGTAPEYGIFHTTAEVAVDALDQLTSLVHDNLDGCTPLGPPQLVIGKDGEGFTSYLAYQAVYKPPA